MADLLHDLLTGSGQRADNSSLEYLEVLASQPLASLEATESSALAQASHSLLISLQALSKRSHKPIVQSADDHAMLRSALPSLTASTVELRMAIPCLDNEVVRFSATFNKSSENDALARKKKAHLLWRNVERLVDVLELPRFLSSAVSIAPVTYSAALDLNGHIRRLHSLYPTSPLVSSISSQAEQVMQTMTNNLILSLKAPGLKLAASLRTVSWLRRILPDLEAASDAGPVKEHDAQERVLGALFLVCRLATLMGMLDALEPLRKLADQEKARQKTVGSTSNPYREGRDTERFLKRYMEIFREQSFAIVSMFRSIFPPQTTPADGAREAHALEPMPSALASFPLYLVDMLLETLRLYLPTVKEQSARDSILTSVLYCAGSLGRLGGDFSLFLADLGTGGRAEEEWIEVVKRHRAIPGLG